MTSHAAILIFGYQGHKSLIQTQRNTNQLKDWRYHARDVKSAPMTSLWRHFRFWKTNVENDHWPLKRSIWYSQIWNQEQNCCSNQKTLLLRVWRQFYKPTCTWFVTLGRSNSKTERVIDLKFLVQHLRNGDKRMPSKNLWKSLLQFLAAILDFDDDVITVDSTLPTYTKTTDQKFFLS